MKSLLRPLFLMRSLSLALIFGGLVMNLAASRVEASARAQSTQAITLTVRAGFDGYYKDSLWMPVRINVANDGPDVHGALTIASPRGSGGEALFTRHIELPTQSRREIFLYIPPEGIVTNLKVALIDGKTELASTTARLVEAGPTDLIYGVLANTPSAFNNLLDVDPASGSAFVAQLEVADLPPIGQGWDTLDVLVVSDMDMGSLSAEQHTALADWVKSGGRLIVAGGPAWQKTTTSLTDVLPISPTQTETLSDFSALGTFAASPAPAGSAVVATGSQTQDATILAQAGDVPLIVSRPFGFGQVTFLAIDPSFAPFKGWDGFRGLFSNILSTPVERPNWADGFRDWSSASSAVNALPGLDLPSSFQICGFLGLYIVVAGPLNYLVLKRLKRRELAWLTIPGLVVLFSGVAYLTGYQLRGAQATLHQLTIVQVWPDSERAQADELIGLVSPRRQSYTLQFADNFLVRLLPSDYSYNSTSDTLSLEQGDQTQISGVRAEIGSVKGFVAQGQVPAPRFDSQLTLDFSGSTPRLNGTVTNQSNLTLVDAVLLAPGGVMRLGDFPPGKSQPVSIYLANMRATSMAQNNSAPVLPVIAGGALPPAYSPTPVNDSTIDDILGNSNYYNDKEAYRRYSLLASAIQSYGGGSRGSGVYLTGWTSAAPVSAKVVNRSFATEAVTLYLVTLRPLINLGQGTTLIIPPGLMTWTVMDPGQSGSPTPYDMTIYSGYSYALRFLPARALPFSQVQQLILHLASYGLTGLAPVRLELWDFTENVWAEQSQLLWGDNKISAPARFVSPAGEIQVRVTNPTSTNANVDLETLDFSLEVKQ